MDGKNTKLIVIGSGLLLLIVIAGALVLAFTNNPAGDTLEIGEGAIDIDPRVQAVLKSRGFVRCDHGAYVGPNWVSPADYENFDEEKRKIHDRNLIYRNKLIELGQADREYLVCEAPDDDSYPPAVIVGREIDERGKIIAETTVYCETGYRYHAAATHLFLVIDNLSYSSYSNPETEYLANLLDENNIDYGKYRVVRWGCDE